MDTLTHDAIMKKQVEHERAQRERFYRRDQHGNLACVTEDMFHEISENSDIDDVVKAIGVRLGKVRHYCPSIPQDVLDTTFAAAIANFSIRQARWPLKSKPTAAGASATIEGDNWKATTAVPPASCNTKEEARAWIDAQKGRA